jgi:hypothetical protein
VGRRTHRVPDALYANIIGQGLHRICLTVIVRGENVRIEGACGRAMEVSGEKKGWQAAPYGTTGESYDDVGQRVLRVSVVKRLDVVSGR